MSMSIARLQTLTKRANQRLRQLEKEGLDKSSLAYKYAEKKAFDDSKLFTTTKKGEIKFTTKVAKLTKEEKMRLEKELTKFLEAKTSTVTGIKKATEKSRKKYEQLVGRELSPEEYNQLFTDSAMKNLWDSYGSQQVSKYIKEQGFDRAKQLARKVQEYEETHNHTASLLQLDAWLDGFTEDTEIINPFE